MSIDATKIANRACQRVGAGRIAAGALFTEDSNSANEIAACYDILRRAELRRNFWRFSIRRAPLRPVDVTTKTFTPTAWSAATTYAVAAIVIVDGIWYSSLIAGNIANQPGDDSASWTRYFGPSTSLPWDATVTYFAGEIVWITTQAYLSLKNTNTDLTSVVTSWLPLLGTLSLFFITYPAGVGPSSENMSRNLYVLPQGFMREAPQAPKAGRSSFLGFPAAPFPNDWVFENNFFVTMDAGVVVFRFAADITNAAEFDPMFVEGLGARIGMEVCERLTQSSAKVATCEKAYKLIMGEARLVNGIEQGPTEQPLDDYIVTRV
jgi:hypothetical protein